MRTILYFQYVSTIQKTNYRSLNSIEKFLVCRTSHIYKVRNSKYEVRNVKVIVSCHGFTWYDGINHIKRN